MKSLFSARLLSLFAVLLCVVPVTGQTRPPKQLNATEILKRSAKALGNEKPLKTATSASFSGTADGQGRFTLDLQAPNQFRLEINHGNPNSVALGNNGISTWRKLLSGEAATLFDAPARNLKVFSELLTHRVLSPVPKWFTAFSHPPEPLNGKECQVVEFRSLERGSVVMYFDSGTFFPVRMESGRGEDMVRLDFEDYRLVDGLREPFRIRFQDGNASPVLLNIERVNHAPEFTANHFNLPGKSEDIDLTSLCRQLIDNLDRTNANLVNYSFSLTETTRALNRDNVVLNKSVEKYEAYPISGQIGSLHGTYKSYGDPLTKLISINGRELSPHEKRVWDRIIHNYLKIEIANKVWRGFKRQSFRLPRMVADILRKSEFLNPRREMFREKPVLVCDFRPRPDSKSTTFGTAWIDQDEGQIWRFESWIGSDKNIWGGFLDSEKKGSVFILEQTRTANGDWFPQYQFYENYRTSFGSIFVNRIKFRDSSEAFFSDFKPFTESDFDALLKETEEALRKKR